MMANALIILVLLMTANIANAAFDWSPKSVCKNLFLTTTHEGYKRAVYIAASAHDTLSVYVKPEALKKPMLISLMGETNPSALTSQISKKRAVIDGLFPIFHALGGPVALITAGEFFAQVKAMEATPLSKNVPFPSYPQFKVLAIDEVTLSESSFPKYKDLAQLVRERFLRGQSTILISSLSSVAEEREFAIFAGVHNHYEAIRFTSDVDTSEHDSDDGNTDDE